MSKCRCDVNSFIAYILVYIVSVNHQEHQYHFNSKNIKNTKSITKLINVSFFRPIKVHCKLIMAFFNNNFDENVYLWVKFAFSLI